MAVSDAITEKGQKYTFRICPKADWYAKDQVNFLKDLKTLVGLDVKKVALLARGHATSVRRPPAGEKKYLARKRAWR